ETIRAYALERLEASGEGAEIRRRHARWFATIDERMLVDARLGEVDWLGLDRDLDNFRAAVPEPMARDPREAFVRLAWNLSAFWINRGYVREGASWSREAVRLAGELPDSVRARAWECAGSFAFRLDDLERADELFQAALEVRRRRGPQDALERAYIVRMLSLIAEERGDGEEADALLNQSTAMFRELGDTRALFVVAHDRAIFTLRRRDYGRARALLEESAARARDLDLGEDLAS